MRKLAVALAIVLSIGGGYAYGRTSHTDLKVYCDTFTKATEVLCVDGPTGLVVGHYTLPTYVLPHCAEDEWREPDTNVCVHVDEIVSAYHDNMGQTP